MLLHRCKCGILIPQELRLCPDCEAKESDKMSRHMEYNLRRRNKKAAAFYVSAEWRKVRAFALSLYDSLDMYAYYVQHKIVVADMVHHITEIEEDWTQRLNVENLFPLSNGNHGGAAAKHYPAALERGRGYRKSFDRAGLVAPPLFCGENSPRKFQV